MAGDMMCPCSNWNVSRVGVGGAEAGWKEQGQVGRDQHEAGTAKWVELGFPGLVGFGLVQCVSPLGINHLVDHHPIVVQRVARLGCV